MAKKKLKREVKENKKRKNAIPVISEEKIKQIDEFMADLSKLTINGEQVVSQSERVKQMMNERNFEYDPLIPYVKLFYERLVNNTSYKSDSPYDDVSGHLEVKHKPLQFQQLINDAANRDTFTGEFHKDIISEGRRFFAFQSFVKFLESSIIKDFEPFDCRLFDEEVFKALSLILKIEEDLLLPFFGAYIAAVIFEYELHLVINECFGNEDDNIFVDGDWLSLFNYSLSFSLSFDPRPNYPPELEKHAREVLKRDPYGLTKSKK